MDKKELMFSNIQQFHKNIFKLTISIFNKSNEIRNINKYDILYSTKEATWAATNF